MRVIDERNAAVPDAGVEDLVAVDAGADVLLTVVEAGVEVLVTVAGRVLVTVAGRVLGTAGAGVDVGGGLDVGVGAPVGICVTVVERPAGRCTPVPEVTGLGGAADPRSAGDSDPARPVLAPEHPAAAAISSAAARARPHARPARLMPPRCQSRARRDRAVPSRS